MNHVAYIETISIGAGISGDVFAFTLVHFHNRTVSIFRWALPLITLHVLFFGFAFLFSSGRYTPELVIGFGVLGFVLLSIAVAHQLTEYLPKKKNRGGDTEKTFTWLLPLALSVDAGIVGVSAPSFIAASRQFTQFEFLLLVSLSITCVIASVTVIAMYMRSKQTGGGLKAALVTTLCRLAAMGILIYFAFTSLLNILGAPISISVTLAMVITIAIAWRFGIEILIHALADLMNRKPN